MQFNHWPDNLHHSSGDVPERTDPTEMKRTGFVGATLLLLSGHGRGGGGHRPGLGGFGEGENRMAEVARQMPGS